MIGAADCFHGREMFAVSSPVASENDYAFAGVIARTPEPVALMVADRFGQAVLLAKEIDRAGLAITVGEDCRLRALLGGKRVVNPADFARHFLPAEFIGEMLRQRSGGLVLRFWRLEPERLLVTNVILRRQNRDRERCQKAGNKNDRDEINWTAPSRALPGEILKRHGSRGEQHRIRGRQIIIFPFQANEGDEKQRVNPAEDAKTLSLFAETKPGEGARPKWKQNQVHQHRLISNERDRAANDIAMSAADVVHQFEKRKVVAEQPDQVRKKNQERTKRADPDPAGH